MPPVEISRSRIGSQIFVLSPVFGASDTFVSSWDCGTSGVLGVSGTSGFSFVRLKVTSTTGVLISSLAWSIFSLAFSMYLDIALAASNMYGSLTMIVFIMIWMYFCMWILLIGAEINAYFEDKLRKLQNAAIEHFMENKETNKEAGK